MKILVTGATGLIGRVLCQLISAEGHSVAALSRSARKPEGLKGFEMYQWDPADGAPPQESLEQVDAVVNLAGESIADHRWTEEQKKRIRDSRIVTTRHLVEGIRKANAKPSVFVSGSAVGFYGNRGDEELDEASSRGRGFMSDVCDEWEREAERAKELGVRVAMIRTGVVLSNEGGALQKMLTPFKIGVGGRLGSGKQWFPWIHIADIAAIFRHAIMNAELSGPINGVAPEPVTNAQFTHELGRVLHRPTFLPVPETALRVLMGEMANVLFDSERVEPRVAQASGFTFQYPSLREALENLLG